MLCPLPKVWVCWLMWVVALLSAWTRQCGVEFSRCCGNVRLLSTKTNKKHILTQSHILVVVGPKDVRPSEVLTEDTTTISSCLCETGSMKDMTAITHTRAHTPHLGMPQKVHTATPRNACCDRQWQWWFIVASWKPAGRNVSRCFDWSRHCHWNLTLFFRGLSFVLFKF